jgi:hypothetical protein
MRAQSRAVAIVTFGVVDLLLFVFELREISLGKVAIRCPKTATDFLAGRFNPGIVNAV